MTSVKASISWIIEKANTSDWNGFRNEIEKWKVTPVDGKPKPYRSKWTEEREELFRETMKEYWGNDT